MKELDQSIETSIGTLEKIIVADDLGQALTGVKTALNEYYPVRDKLSGLVREGKQEEAFNLLQGDVAVYGKKLGDADHTD